jgi:hypothetical protein
MKIYFVLFILIFAFVSGCSSQPTSMIEVSSDGTVSISIDSGDIDGELFQHSDYGKRFQHAEVLDGNETYSMTINGHHFEIRDGNVKFNGQEIARPEGSTIKITQENASVFIYVDDRIVQEVRIDE